MPFLPAGSAPARHARCRAWILFLALAATPGANTALRAQTPDSTRAEFTRADSARHSKPLFRRSDLRTAIAFGAVGAALLPLDTHITNVVRAHPASASSSRVLSVVNEAAFPGAYLLGYSAYGLGLVTGSASLTRVGVYTAASVIASSHITDALKGLAGRERPWAATNSDEFRGGRGFKDDNWTSFPSGHATVAFAAATAFVDGSRQAWPHEPGFVAPVAYGAATAVALARVYGQAHWASDVVAGAAVGTFTARFIVRAAAAHPGNWLEKIAVHGALSLDDRGRAALGWHSSSK